MSQLSTSLLATSRRLIRQFGENVQFDRVVNGAFIPSTGGVATGTETGYYAFGVQQPTPNREVNGTTILQSDLVLYVEVNDINYAPLVGDVATLDGQAYRVLAVNNTVLQGQALVYKLQIRI